MQRALYDFDDLLELMQRDGLMHQADRPTFTVHVPTQLGELDGLMMLRWLEHEGVIQLVHALPFIVPWKTRPDFIEALNILNHALPLAGFSLHPTQAMPYYRRELPFAPRGWIFDEELRWWFGMSVDVVQTFLQPLQRLASGDLSTDSFLEDPRLDLTRNFRPPSF